MPDGTGWMKPPFTAEAKRQALEAGIDLEDRSVQEHLLRVFEKKRTMESELLPPPSSALDIYAVYPQVSFVLNIVPVSC